jgi:chromosome segregation ATPase
MDWKAAIALLKTLEGTSESIAALEGEISRLTNANFELVKDVRNASSKSKESETKLTDLLQILGAEGEDLKSRTASANDKIKTLQSENNKVSKEKTELEEKYKTLDEERSLLKRRTIINEAAVKSGAVADVLTQLTKDIPLERIILEKDEVLLASEDGKSKTALKEYAQTEWAAFVPALFPKEPSSTRLPNGGTGGNKPNDVSPLQTYRASTYDKTIAKLTNKN